MRGLATQGLDSSSEPSSRKARRILFVSGLFPSGFERAVYGAHQRMRLFLEAAASASETLDILFFVEPSFVATTDRVEFAEQLYRHWGIRADVHICPRATRARPWLKANVEPIWNVRELYSVYKTGGAEQARAVAACVRQETDLIVAFQLESMLPVMRAKKTLPPAVVDLNDVEHIRFPRILARPPRTLRNQLQYLYLPALFLAERRAIRSSVTTFVCSEVARAYLERVVGKNNVKVAPNAVAFPNVATPPVRDGKSSASRSLLFIGIYAYPPNLEAAEWLVRTIFPLVLRLAPDARLVFAGSHIERIAHLSGMTPNVEFAGFIPELADVYARAAVSVCPILAGGGTRTKIIEAAAYRMPVVSTKLGAEGLDFEDGREILLRDDPEAFARACVEMLDDPVRAALIAERAYIKARTYDRVDVIPAIAAELARLVGARSNRR